MVMNDTVDVELLENMPAEESGLFRLRPSLRLVNEGIEENLSSCKEAGRALQTANNAHRRAKKTMIAITYATYVRAEAAGELEELWGRVAPLTPLVEGDILSA